MSLSCEKKIQTDTDPCLCADTSASIRLLHLSPMRGDHPVQVSGKQTSPQNITQITSEMLGTAKAGGTQQPIGYKRALM